MNSDDIDFATMSAYELIAMLDAAFPHQCIQKNQTEIDAHREAGRRELIDELVTAMNDERSARTD